MRFFRATLIVPVAAAAVLFVAKGARAQLAQCDLPKLLASHGAAGDVFGSSVSVCGDTAVIGPPGDEDSGIKAGRQRARSIAYKAGCVFPLPGM